MKSYVDISSFIICDSPAKCRALVVSLELRAFQSIEDKEKVLLLENGR